MRIFEINSFGNLSTGTIAANVADAVIESGGSCEFAYGRGKYSGKAQGYKFAGRFGVFTHILLSRLTDRSGFFSSFATKRLIKEVQQFSPDVIHIHNLHGYYLNVKILFDFLSHAGIPVVWTLHDCWAFTGHCCYYVEDQCTGWKSDGYCNNIRSYPKSWYVNSSRKNFREKIKLFTSVPNLTIVSVSNWLDTQVKQSKLSSLNNVVIQNGIDNEIFHYTPSNCREQLGISVNEKMVLGVASSWDKRKGLADFEQLVDVLPANVKVVLVGLTTEQIKKLDSRIIGLPRTHTTRELVELYSGADVFVNASVEETFGLTTLEAMSCGTSVIVYDSTALPEVVGSGCGKVVPIHDVGEVAKVINNTEFARINSEAIRFSKNFSIKKFKQQYLDLFRTTNLVAVTDGHGE